MPASVSSPADVVNLSLRRMGYKLRVGSLFDGSKAANNALDIYAQTRDELMRQDDIAGFAKRTIQPALLKSAPPGGYIPGLTPWDPLLYPQLPYLFEYQYPDDCLKVRALKPVPIFIPNFDPQPNVWEIGNDNTFSTPPTSRKVIFCFVAQTALTYTGQVTDPSLWEADFTEAMAATLARRLAPCLVGMEVAKLEAGDEANAMNVAQMNQG